MSTSTEPPQGADLPRCGPTLVDAWYAESLGPFGAHSIDAAIASRFAPAWVRLGRRISCCRGVLWFWISRGAERVVCPFSARGLLTYLVLHQLLSSRAPKLWLVEFLRAEPVGWPARLRERVHVMMFARLLAPVLAGAQVMTRWEADAYARKYRLPPSRFTCIAFPMLRQPCASLPQPTAAPVGGVLSSGRAACDWATLLRAAAGASWPLTIVCSAEDRAAVDALNHDGRARVLSEIPQEEHQRLLQTCTVYALVLREQRASSGQVRMARAIEAGIPVVATAVRGLEGYLEAQTTALAVPVGDAAVLRAAIESLLHDQALREALRRSAHAAMRSRSLDAYVQQIRGFVFELRNPVADA